MNDIEKARAELSRLEALEHPAIITVGMWNKVVGGLEAFQRVAEALGSERWCANASRLKTIEALNDRLTKLEAAQAGADDADPDIIKLAPSIANQLRDGTTHVKLSAAKAGDTIPGIKDQAATIDKLKGAVAVLKGRLEGTSRSRPKVFQEIGTFMGDPVYAENALNTDMLKAAFAYSIQDHDQSLKIRDTDRELSRALKGQKDQAATIEKLEADNAKLKNDIEKRKERHYELTTALYQEQLRGQQARDENAQLKDSNAYLSDCLANVEKDGGPRA